MNRIHFDQIIDNYAARFVELNTGDNNEVYKWEIAAEFRPMMDAALAADDTDFPAKLAAVVLLTEQTIDNGAELAFHALADYARSEPQAVRNALHQLLTPDGGDLEARTQRFSEFLGFCESMRAKYYPDSWRYRASIRLPMMITGFYDPDHYYMYKASQAQAYADCVEFYDDWGSGAKMDLRIYHRMCDELIETIKLHPKFKMIRDTRKNYAEKPLHPDTELHILAFDVIFCSTVYNLFEGIHYSVRNAEEKRIHLEKWMRQETREQITRRHWNVWRSWTMRRPFSRKSSPLAARSPTSGSVSVRSPACLAKSSKSNSPDSITPQRSYGATASRQDCFPSKRLRMLPSTTSWSHCSVRRR